MSIEKITIRKPDDMHFHLRYGLMLQNVLPFSSCVFGRGVVMGNLFPPVDDAKSIVDYRREILSMSPGFDPIMAMMLTRKTTVEILDDAYRAGAKVLKFIPGTASTGGAQGLDLPDLYNLRHILEAVRDRGMIFSCHFELTTKDGCPVSMLEQEQEAIPFAEHLVDAIPGLKLVVEHVSSVEMIEFVKSAPSNVAATLTAHHAIITCEDVFDKDRIIDPFLFCKPIAKMEGDRKMIREAMIGGDPKFFFGSDSAPHNIMKKRGKSPVAGIFSSPVALPLLCQIFEEEGALGKLENFTSLYGAQFYGLPLNEGTVTIEKRSWTVPDSYEYVKIFMGGREMKWRVC